MTLLRRADIAAGPSPRGWRCPAPSRRRRPGGAPDPRIGAGRNLPESRSARNIRQSGQWRTDAPAAITGR